MEQNSLRTSYQKDESWTILSPIEQSIKQKIEAVGTPLKEWDISINYGIKTGFNEAFIISGEKRKEILEACQSEYERERTAQLIRPILRGKDIKRYSYEFADKYLITTYNAYTDSEGNKIPSINISDYPAVKAHLDVYWTEISKRLDKGDTPYNLRRCAYMDDFNKPKIIWKVIGSKLAFSIDFDKMLVNNACYILTGCSLEYLVLLLNSKVILWYSEITNMNKTGTGDAQVGAQNIILFPIPIVSTEVQKIFSTLFEQSQSEPSEILLNSKIYDLFDFSQQEREFLNNFSL